MAGGSPWVMWIIMIVGTVAFWVAVFLAVRALYFDRATSSAPHRRRIRRRAAAVAPGLSSRTMSARRAGPLTDSTDHVLCDSGAATVHIGSRPVSM